MRGEERTWNTLSVDTSRRVLNASDDLRMEREALPAWSRLKVLARRPERAAAAAAVLLFRRAKRLKLRLSARRRGRKVRGAVALLGNGEAL